MKPTNDKVNSKLKTKIVLTDLFSIGKEVKMKDYKFTFIDLFAGIGGIRIGFEHAGGEYKGKKSYYV
jgi:hypothetical protein